MDRLESWGEQLSNLTVYDIKNYYNSAKNKILNIPEMEAKVMEATNDETWGASSTLMQEIAQGTFNFQQFNEIMPCIYSRFTEKEARQWREIYKALQLLEYIVKHGSERVVDDARSHLSTIKLLRNFHYIDEKGKDQGINVRNRAKELAELLMDVDKIRSERRKAKANRNKYTGVGSEAYRYGGFGNSSGGSGGGGGGGSSGYGGGYDRDYGSSSSYNNHSSSSGFRDNSSSSKFEEYNAGDDEVSTTPSYSATRTTSSATTNSTSRTASVSVKPTKAKEVDLLGFADDDDSLPAPAAPPVQTNKALPALAQPNLFDDGDDDFADFQAAPVAAAAPVSPPVQPQQKTNVYEFLTQTQNTAPTHSRQPSIPLQPQQQQQPNYFNTTAAAGGMFTSPVSPSANKQTFGGGVMQPQSPAANAGAGVFSGGVVYNATSPAPSSAGSRIGTGNAAAPPASAGKASVGFDDLWSMSLGSSNSKPAGGAAGGKSMKDLEKEKAQAGIWGAGSGMGGASSSLFDTMGGSTATSTSTGAGDDLLL
ncbi:ENTH-domain-containing protein [Schizopora paradoxa]|uniref:ENTH-domain-containing protein n=1 Tax=Schizopora paradoxa TaxID=27342 RepID=A0A0H2RIU5_9AGAM|nr:ENTH-domain-containing protein [Schizopora paradoxa]